MSIKIYYRITQDHAGIPLNYTGARHFTPTEGQLLEDMAISQLAADYQVPASAVEICKIEA